MFLVVLALLHAAEGFDINVEGDVAIDVRVPNMERGRQHRFRQGWEDGKEAHEELVFKMMQVRQNVTAAPEVECTYQYPEKDQVNAMLSNMMNELTKIFVRANDFITGVETRRRKTSKEKPITYELWGDQRRGDDSRFKVVNKKHKDFFELIYANMTNEYRNFYNTTVERVDRTDRDPCQHQDEVKQIWHDLLEHSLATLRKATHRCVDEYLHDQKVEPKSKVAKNLEQYLMRELSKVRSSQLDMLCDVYQLCYNELLK